MPSRYTIGGGPVSRTGTLDVKDYGAKGDGVTDDTAAINAAVAAQGSTGTPVFFPPGSYVYTGNGYDLGTVNFCGASMSSTYILIGAGKYFVDSNQVWSTLNVSDLSFYGGAGAIRNRYTGGSVAGHLNISDCFFDNYTGAAITNNAVDQPYWKISNCTFNGANDTGSTMGIAITGLVDSSTISDCSFRRNRVNIKIGQGANNVHLRDSDFVRFNAYAGTARTNLWIVPAPAYANSGTGTVVSGNKFGGENYDSADYHILFADEGTGITFGERFPALGSDSTGYVSNHAYVDNYYQFASNGGPAIYSTTPFVGGVSVSGVTAGGMTEVIKFRTAPTGGVPDLVTNLFGPIRVADENAYPPPLSLAGGVGRQLDPTGTFEGDINTAHGDTGGAGLTAFARLDTAKVTGWSIVAGTITASTDALGGTDAVEVTHTGAATIYHYLASAKLRLHAPMWVEFDARAVSGSAVDGIAVVVKRDDNSSFSMRRSLRLPSVAAGWQRYRFQVHARSTAANTLLLFNSFTGGAYRIGRVRVYHAREPHIFEHVLTSPNGTRYLLNVSDAGALSTTVVP